jgi:anti-sigma28 factor (negative regulator of flagellin synthesis)
MKKNTEQSHSNTSSHEEKINQFKQAIKNNTYAINSDAIASALLEAQQFTRQKAHPLEEPELA